MFLNGSLENFSVADILQLLSFSRQSGALYVQGEIGAVLYLEDGDAYFARRDSDWPLKDTLFANGVDESDWNDVVAESSEIGSIGEALVTRDAIDQDLLAYVVHRQLFDTLFDLFRMPRRGTFDFRVAERHQIGPVQRYKVDALIGDTRRRVDEWASISEFISSPAAMVSVVSELPAERVELSLDAAQWDLLLLAVGRDRSTLTDLARALSRTDTEVARALDGLIRAGLVAVLEMKGESPIAAAAPMAEDIQPPLPVEAATLNFPHGGDTDARVEDQDPIPVWGREDESPGAEDVAEIVKEAPPEETSVAPEWFEREVGTSDDGVTLSDVTAEGAPADGDREVESWWQETAEAETSAAEWDAAWTQTEPGDPLPSADRPPGRGDALAASTADAGEDLSDSIWGGPPDEAASSDAPELEDEASLWDAPNDGDTSWTPPAGNEGAEPWQPESREGSPGWQLPPEHISPQAPDAAEPADDQRSETSQSEPGQTGDGPSEPELQAGESSGFRTVALQELRNLAGVAGTPVRSPGSSKRGAEASDKPPQPQPAPKIRALKRLIAAVRGL